MSLYLCRLLTAFELFNYILGSVPKCRCWPFSNNCISNVTMFNIGINCAQMAMMLFSQQLYLWWHNSLWHCTQVEMLPFCKHLCQWGHHIFCTVPIWRWYIQDLFTVYLYFPVNWRYTWAHRKHTVCNDVCAQQLWSTLHRDRHNMLDIHISSYSRFHPIRNDVIWCYPHYL